jgi:hypothetical protein
MKIYIKSTTEAGNTVISELKSYLKGPADLGAKLLINRVTKEDISDKDLANAVNFIDIALQVADKISDKLGVTPEIYSPFDNKIEIINLPGTAYTSIDSTDIDSYADNWVAIFLKFFKRNYKATISTEGILTPNQYIDKMLSYVSNNVYAIDDEDKLRKAISGIITPTYRRNK